MYNKLYISFLFAIILIGCNNSKQEEHKEEAKIQLVEYTNEFELFAEADPFVVGKTSNVLSHFTELSNFKPVEEGNVDLILNIDGIVTTSTISNPTKKGIYSFSIKPKNSGNGFIEYVITKGGIKYYIKVNNVKVYSSVEKSKHEIHEEENAANTVPFTKEKSWKIDFATGFAQYENFGDILKTTAKIVSAQDDERMITAKFGGIVNFSSNQLSEGAKLTKGELLCNITSGNFPEDDFRIKYLETKNKFEQVSNEYERVSKLYKDKIVTESEYLSAKALYLDTKNKYELYSKSFNPEGEKVVSPINGYITKLFVTNGSYVSTGTPVAVVSENKSLVLTAEIQRKYFYLLNKELDVNIKVDNEKFVNLKDVEGKRIISGNIVSQNNFSIPLSFLIKNKFNFLNGGIVDVFIKAKTEDKTFTVPNSAIIEEQGNYFVYVQVTPELFEKREVVIGKTDGVKTEIKEGITSNDRIVLKGAYIIKIVQSSGSLDPHSGHMH